MSTGGGPEELLVAAKISVPGTSHASEVADAIDAAERRVRDAVPIARVIYLEPDLYEAGHVPDPRPEAPAAPDH